METIQLTDRDSDQLKSLLLPGEEIQWRGTSEPFPLVVPENKARLIFRWILCAVLMIALSVIYPLWTRHIQGEYLAGVNVIIVLLFTYVGFFMPIIDRRTILRRTIYYVTSKRVITVVGDKSPYVLNRTGLKAEFIDSGNGCIHGLFGSAVGTKPGKCRLATLAPKTDDTGDLPTGVVFYNIRGDQPLPKGFFQS